MNARCGALAIGFALLLSCVPASACECYNSTPVEKNLERYRDRAVFTAHTIQIVGAIGKINGERWSNVVLALVKERYWGLPWYWPKIVLLDGGTMCGMGLAEGKDYLVSGLRMGYGAIDVSGCSRTQPLSTAQVDVRTLDGTHCAAPGGTFIGHVRGDWDQEKREDRPAKVSAVAFSDLSGKTYRAEVDANGIYELRSIPSVLYAPISQLDDARYLWVGPQGFIPMLNVKEGECQELNLTVRDYALTGRLLPGIGNAVKVELLNIDASSKPIRADSIEPDGRFYFRQIPLGKYLLQVTSTIGDVNPHIFYPGVTDRAKAVKIVVDGSQNGRSYDFDARVLPVVPIAVVLDRVAGSERFLWDFQLTEGGSIKGVSKADGTNVGLVYGMRGGSYELQLYGYPHRPLTEPFNDDYCTSESVPLTAVAGMAPVRVTARCVHGVR